ncbi:hypothetical protein QF049_003494 [Paenibacillus sp. W4I10]|uniref:phage tail protein n=1 Tax=Paenibacillus sp. W4I10 TaxID=3042298 RepID=UPI00278B944D|nr:phage tail protein [Paenibacillus sp. W4I10]MDQ0722233.1 hypothetical protein [Paenibacillus sp. W4I10]
MPQETDRLKLPLPLGNETVNRESINEIFEKIDAGVATQADLDTLREAISQMDIPDASLTQKGKVQLSSKTDGTSETVAATEKAVNDVLAAANASSLPRTGGALTGPLRISSWGDISASSGGYVLYGHNCYLDAAGVVYRYRNTHATMGARGIVFRLGAGLQGAWMFDMGAIATTAGTAFTPTLKRILNIDDYTALLDAAKAYADNNFRKPSEIINANLVKNSSGLIGMNYWTNVGAVPFSTTVNPTLGGMFFVTEAVSAQQYAVLDSEIIGVDSGHNYLLQAMFHTAGVAAGAAVLIEIKNADSDVTIDSLVADPQRWWHRKAKFVLIPSGVSAIKVRLVVSNANFATKGFGRIGFMESQSGVDVPYTMERDTLALYGQIEAVKQSGVDAKNGIVGAINAKGGSASTNDTWVQLADKVTAIKQPYRVYNASVWYAGGTISNIPFKPYMVMVFVSGVKSDNTGGSTVDVRASGTIGAYVNESGNTVTIGGPGAQGYYGSSSAAMTNVVFGSNSVSFSISYGGYPSNQGNVTVQVFGL